MKDSRRSRRMERSHKRHKRGGALNLVSLMDIFTILVFFLLVNSSEGEVLPSTRNIELPESISEQKPRENVVVMVTATHILVQGNRVASIKDTSEDDIILPLKQALESQQKRLLSNTGSGAQVPEVTIMGNKEIPYSVLRKVMATCTEAGYGHIALAVLQKTAQES